jgi:hypothetical protein
MPRTRRKRTPQLFEHEGRSYPFAPRQARLLGFLIRHAQSRMIDDGSAAIAVWGDAAFDRDPKGLRGRLRKLQYDLNASLAFHGLLFQVTRPVPRHVLLEKYA